MAEAIRRCDWLETEELAQRSAYWEYLMERWLWRAPFAVVSPAVRPGLPGPDVPPREALHDFGWLKVPESTVSH